MKKGLFLLCSLIISLYSFGDNNYQIVRDETGIVKKLYCPKDGGSSITPSFFFDDIIKVQLPNTFKLLKTELSHIMVLTVTTR